MTVDAVRRTALEVARPLAAAELHLQQAMRMPERLSGAPNLHKLLAERVGHAHDSVRTAVDAASAVGMERTIGATAHAAARRAATGLALHRDDLSAGRISMGDVLGSDALTSLETARRQALAHIGTLDDVPATSRTTPGDAAGATTRSSPGIDDPHLLDSLGNVPRAVRNEASDADPDEAVHTGSWADEHSLLDDVGDGGSLTLL